MAPLLCGQARSGSTAWSSAKLPLSLILPREGGGERRWLESRSPIGHADVAQVVIGLEQLIEISIPEELIDPGLLPSKLAKANTGVESSLGEALHQLVSLGAA